MSTSLQVTFHGVRGSTPCPTTANARYGGNTSCVVADVPGEAPVVFDLGTGVRSWGEHQPLDGTFRASALVTHFHFDHVQGLPFLAAADRPGACFDVYGPGRTGHTVADLCKAFIRPPYFPVALEQLRGRYESFDVWSDEFYVGTSKVTVRPVPHVGETVGYRLDWGGRSIAYIPDHQAPADLSSVDEAVLELADGVDLLIHDAQYTEVDWETKAHWGHSTIEYAVHVAAEAGAKTLALFHHDPTRHDVALDGLAQWAGELAAKKGVVAFAAREGLSVVPGQGVARAACMDRCPLGPLYERGHDSQRR